MFLDCMPLVQALHGISVLHNCHSTLCWNVIKGVKEPIIFRMFIMCVKISFLQSAMLTDINSNYKLVK